MKSKKLNLEAIRLNSFVTNVDNKDMLKAKGGATIGMGGQIVISNCG